MRGMMSETERKPRYNSSQVCSPLGGQALTICQSTLHFIIMFVGADSEWSLLWVGLRTYHLVLNYFTSKYNYVSMTLCRRIAFSEQSFDHDFKFFFFFFFFFFLGGGRVSSTVCSGVICNIDSHIYEASVHRLPYETRLNNSWANVV